MRPINNGTYEIRRNISLLRLRYDTTMKYSKYLDFFISYAHFAVYYN